MYELLTGEADQFVGRVCAEYRYVQYFGCISPEERCLGGLRGIDRWVGRRVAKRTISIRDCVSQWSELSDRLTSLHRKEAVPYQVEDKEWPLLVEEPEVQKMYEWGSGLDGKGVLVIDISSMPKRVWYLIVRYALEDPRWRQVLVLYTRVVSRRAGEPIARNPRLAEGLPGFRGFGRPRQVAAVAVGMEALGLGGVVEDLRGSGCDLVFYLPFPGTREYTRRVWKTVMDVSGPSELPRVERVDSLDAFGMYLALARSQSGCGTEPDCVLVPYGPKPLSLGMCLWAIEHGAEVLYAQPESYNPRFAVGCGSTTAYLVRSSGLELPWCGQREVGVEGESGM